MPRPDHIRAMIKKPNGLVEVGGKMQHTNSELHVFDLAQSQLEPSNQLQLALGSVDRAHDRDDRTVSVAILHFATGNHGEIFDNLEPRLC